MFSYLFITILGLIVGSFLSMLTYRLPRNLSLKGRSYCAKCKQTIPWFLNIPIFSYLFLGAKCANCKARISLRYPLIELFTALAFVSTLFLWSQRSLGVIELQNTLGDFALPFYLLLTTFYVAIFITDLERKIIPDQLLVLMGGMVVIFVLLLPPPQIYSRLLSGAVSFCFFLLIYLLSRGRGMGFGDVKMVPIIAVFLGLEASLIWLFISFLLGGVLGLLLLLFGLARFGKPIPFGPYLLFCAYITFFFGESIMKWYLGIGI